MKNILIAARDLKIGGIEKALLTLINYFIEHGNNVTLVLEEKKGELLKQLNTNVKIIEYKPCSIKFMPIRKIINFNKRINFIIKNKNKYDVSISFATYSKVGSFVARVASKKSILWCHADYLELFDGNQRKVKDFFWQLYYDKFSKIVFVSKKAKKSFIRIFPNMKNVYYCNNLINSNEIYEKTEEKINIEYNQEVTTFVNVGRHDEKQKKLTRIIKAAIILKRDGYKFRIIFVGSGPDTIKYKRIVQKYNLQKNVLFTGEKENPYPYYKIANCVVISSDYEGYPVVFLESYVLNKPIITTDVSDFEDIKDGRGFVVKKDEKEIYKAMKLFIENGYTIKKEFNSVKYNFEIENKLKKILFY